MKIVGLSLAIVVLLSLMVGSTLAYMQDSETSSNNPLAAGTLDMKIKNSDGTSGDINFTTLKPNGSTGTIDIPINNAGTIAGMSIDFTFTYSGTGNGSKTPADLAKLLQVTVLDYDRSLLTSNALSDLNGNGYIDVDDLAAATTSPYVMLTGLRTNLGTQSSLTQHFRIQLNMRYLDKNNNYIADIDQYKGCSVNLTMQYNLRQTDTTLSLLPNSSTVTQTLSMSPVGPGASSGLYGIWLQNNSATTDGSRLATSFSYTKNAKGSLTANAVAQLLEVTRVEYNNGNLLSSMTPISSYDADSNGYIDMYDLAHPTSSMSTLLSNLAGINYLNNPSPSALWDKEFRLQLLNHIATSNGDYLFINQSFTLYP